MSDPGMSLVPGESFAITPGYQALEAVKRADTRWTREQMREIGENLVRDLTEMQAAQLKARIAHRSIVEFYEHVAERAYEAIERMTAPPSQSSRADYWKQAFEVDHMKDFGMTMAESRAMYRETTFEAARRSTFPTPPPEGEKPSFLARLFQLEGGRW